MHNQHPYLAYVEDIAEGCGGYVTCLTLLLITLMRSVERWLHITNPSLLTVRRTFYVLVVVSLLLVPAAVFISLFFLRKIHLKASNIIVIVALLFFLITTSIAYFEVFRNICRQQKKIQASKGRPHSRCVMNLSRYKKSVITILYILGAFYISVLPFFTFVVLYLWYSHSRLQLMFTVSLMFLFLSPSLNPVIYLWRMNDIRNAVKQLSRQLFCKSS